MLDNKTRKYVAKLKEGDRRAFDEIYMKYHQKIYYFSIQYFYSREEAEEIVQEVFIKLWLNRHNINPEKDLEAYIYTIAKHYIYNDLKKKINQKSQLDQYKEDASDSGNANVENEVLYKELEVLFYESIKKLPPMRREVFIMCKIQGMSYKEVAETIGLSIKTVETHMQLALKYLRQIFSKWQSGVYVLAFILLSCAI